MSDQKTPYTLVYDGDCGFCRRSLELLQSWQSELILKNKLSIDYIPLQSTTDPYRDIAKANFHKAVYLFNMSEPNSAPMVGAEAILFLLKKHPFWGLWFFTYKYFSPAKWLLDFVYQWIAQHRHFAGKCLKTLFNFEKSFQQHQIATRLWIKILAISHFFAFFSLFKEAKGLFGHQGLAPMIELMNYLKKLVPSLSWIELPSLFRYPLVNFGQENSDLLIGTITPLIGMTCSILLLFSIGEILNLVICFLLYLSYVTLGQEFMSFQWDILLLEASALTMILPQENSRFKSGPAIILLNLLWIKLIFSSGIVKVLASNPAWIDLEALKVHFATQPLPGPLAIIFHSLPNLVLSICCLIVLGIQILTPIFLILFPRIRSAIFWANLCLQTLIFISGNYNIFNLVATGLTFLILPDKSLVSIFGIQFFKNPRVPDLTWAIFKYPLLLFFIFINFTFCFLPLTSFDEFASLRNYNIAITMQRLGLLGNYGLFANMTMTRPEIIFEAYWDKNSASTNKLENGEWHEIDLKYKPGNPNVAPTQVAPFHPRLDWQLWFAALGETAVRSPWIYRLTKEILRGNRAIYSFFQSESWPESPPDGLRAWMYDYEMNSLGNYLNKKNFWARKNKRVFLDPLALQSSSLKPFIPSANP